MISMSYVSDFARKYAISMPVYGDGFGLIQYKALGEYKQRGMDSYKSSCGC